VFNWSTVSLGGTIFDPFISASWSFVSAGVILKGPIKGLSGESYSNLCIALTTSSSNNVPLFRASATFASLFYSLALIDSYDVFYYVSTWSSMVIAFNLVILGLGLL
jgi:hypothetical protein